jgi:hypothetical protein
MNPPLGNAQSPKLDGVRLHIADIGVASAAYLHSPTFDFVSRLLLALFSFQLANTFLDLLGDLIVAQRTEVAA